MTWNGAAAQVDSNQSLTGCAITAGDPLGNFAITASGAGCNITVTSTGVANLNGTSGSVFQTLTVTGSNGNGTSAGVSVPVTVWADGSTGAPSCTPPNASLLNGYAVRAPWPVAGVDYCVGIPSAVTLSDPAPSGVLSATLTADGCSLSGATITCSGANCNNKTIQDWDFGLHGNGLNIGTCSGLTIQNNNFKLASSIAAIFEVVGTTNLTIQNNVIDANGFSNSSDGVIEGNSPSMTVQYNIIQNGAAENLRLGATATTFNNTVQFNLIRNAGINATNTGLHGDWVQIISAPGDNVTSANFLFNTFVQSDASPPTQSQGISYNGNVHGNFIGENVLNNTMVAAPNTGVVNLFVNADWSWLNGTLTSSNNYIDPTGLTGSLTNWNQFVSGTGPFTGALVCNGNFNMKTGAKITVVSVTPPNSGACT